MYRVLSELTSNGTEAYHRKVVGHRWELACRCVVLFNQPAPDALLKYSPIVDDDCELLLP